MASVVSASSGGEGSNFRFIYKLTKGETYYFHCRIYNGYSGDYYCPKLVITSLGDEPFETQGTITKSETFDYYWKLHLLQIHRDKEWNINILHNWLTRHLWMFI